MTITETQLFAKAIVNVNNVFCIGTFYLFIFLYSCSPVLFIALYKVYILYFPFFQPKPNVWDSTTWQCCPFKYRIYTRWECFQLCFMLWSVCMEKELPPKISKPTRHKEDFFPLVKILLGWVCLGESTTRERHQMIEDLWLKGLILCSLNQHKDWHWLSKALDQSLKE